MSRGRRRWSGDERRALLAALEESGLSAWSFAREAGVPYSTLLHWRRLEAPAAPRLVPVEVVREADEPRVAFEVVVGDVVLRVGRDVDDALLTRVVRALRAC